MIIVIPKAAAAQPLENGVPVGCVLGLTQDIDRELPATRYKSDQRIAGRKSIVVAARNGHRSIIGFFDGAKFE